MISVRLRLRPELPPGTGSREWVARLADALSAHVVERYPQLAHRGRAIAAPDRMFDASSYRFWAFAKFRSKGRLWRTDWVHIRFEYVPTNGEFLIHQSSLETSRDRALDEAHRKAVGRMACRLERGCPRDEVEGFVCPACGTGMVLSFAPDGSCFTLSCPKGDREECTFRGKHYHTIRRHRLPPWWREFTGKSVWLIGNNEEEVLRALGQHEVIRVGPSGTAKLVRLPERKEPQ